KADNLVIQGCTIGEIQNHGITNHLAYHPAGTEPRLKNLVIKDNKVYNTCLENPKKSGQGISVAADGFLVSGNEVWGCKDIGIDIWLGATHGEVVDNWVHDNAMGMYVDGARYVRIHRNRMNANRRTGLTVSSEDPAFTTRHIWIFNNLSYDHTAGDGMSMWDNSGIGATDVLFANNTLLNNRSTFTFFGRGNTAELMNNLGYATGLATYDESARSSYAMHDNLWLTSPTGFVSASGKDFRLTSSSPAINKGKALPVLRDDLGNTYAISTDYQGLGRAVSAAPDAGAYELQ
ncbi:MAG TPA: right-handed parallel beta-helix repeat-containing protein, partial [Pantanalinema sp.]